MRSEDAAIPQFGECLPNREYVPRPGAYALIADRAGRLAVIRTGGRCYLPGGGVEPGESLEAALRREVWEECGLQVGELRPLGTADQLVYARDEQRHYRKRCTFFVTWLLEQPPGQTETGTDLLWLTPSEAERQLAHASQVWAVQRFRAEAIQRPDRR